MFGGFLRQSTVTTINLGPFVDATDGFTPETGLTAGTVDDLVLSKNGGASVDLSASAFTAKTDADGCYTLALSASNTDTVGRLDIYVRDTSVCRPLKTSFFVLAPNVYDSLIGSEFLQVNVAQLANDTVDNYINASDNVIRSNVVQINADNTAASNLQKGAFVTEQLIAQTSSTTTNVISNSTVSVNDHYNGRTIIFTSGNLLRQQAQIVDYDGATKTFVVSAMTQAPNNGDTFIVL